MKNSKFAAAYLRPLAIDFAGHRSITEKELHKNRNWKKIMRLAVDNRYDIILLALKGLLQQRNPGFENGLWRLLVAHDLDHMLYKADVHFLWNIADTLGSADRLDYLPRDFCWSVLNGLKKVDMAAPLDNLLRQWRLRYDEMDDPSEELKDWMGKVWATFPAELRTVDNYGTYFVDSFEEKQAWHDLDIPTKNVIKQYETDLFYDRGPKPSEQRQEEVIQAITDSKLKNRHKKALIESIRKKS